MSEFAVLPASLAVSGTVHHHDGAGVLLRTVIVVGFLGAGLLAWFLLRGYRGD
ncbi:hypothetical protein RKE29_10080 [Streptomyces sp. B1866]|uniref:hypothetical protein n=1 Tax=Streptomyces sp. B1866 TaxID=3075431 RepID=UPI00288DCF4A|nr:hypothetical protein [Streptomyces sp. B1866]MDT3396991.1 hypothetical protein [Streptomyces sp. B1866]